MICKIYCEKRRRICFGWLSSGTEMKSGKGTSRENDSDLSSIKTIKGRILCYFMLCYVMLCQKPVLARNLC